MFSEPDARTIEEATRLAGEAMSAKGDDDHLLGVVAMRAGLSGDRDANRLVQAIAYAMGRTDETISMPEAVGSHLAVQNDAYMALAINGLDGYRRKGEPTTGQRLEAERIAGRPELTTEAMIRAAGRFQDISEFSQRNVVRDMQRYEADRRDFQNLRSMSDDGEKRLDAEYGARMARTFNSDPRIGQGVEKPANVMGDAAFREAMVAMGTRAVAMASWPRAEAAEWFGHADPDAISRNVSSPVVPFERGEREATMMAWLVQERRRSPVFDDAYRARIELHDQETNTRIEKAQREGSHDYDLPTPQRKLESDRALMIGREAIVADGIPVQLRSRQEPKASLPRDAELNPQEIGAGIVAMRAHLELDADDALRAGRDGPPRALAAQFLYHTLPLVVSGVLDPKTDVHARDVGHREMTDDLRRGMNLGDATPYVRGLAAVEDLSRWKKMAPEAAKLFAVDGDGSWARATIRNIEDRNAEGDFVHDVLMGVREDFAGEPRQDAPVRRETFARQAALARGGMGIVR